MGLFFDPQHDRTQVWSNGGGTQSAAIAALIVQGRLPKPDIAVIVDTERENSDTFEYQRRFVFPALSAVGVECQVVPKSVFATVDLTSKNGKSILIPAFTTASGQIGKLPTFCSVEWKERVVSRHLRTIGVKQCDMWMGFSLDEMRRVKKDSKAWRRKVYPLIDLRLRRNDCIVEVLNMGWPKPPRSSCWMCPNKCNAEWKDMRDNRPADFALAVAFDYQLRETDPDMYLHESCVPLDQVDFDTYASSGFEKGCESGLCFV